MSRIRADVPLIVLPGRAHPILPCTVPASVTAHAAAALDEFTYLVDAAGCPDANCVRQAAPLTAKTMRGLAFACATASDAPDPEQLEPRRSIHEYFGVRHDDHMTSPTVGVYALAAATWCVDDLPHVNLDASEVLAEILAIRTIIDALATADTADLPTPGAPVGPLIEWTPDGGAWHRWIVAHHLYLALNLFAAASIRRAVACLTTPGNTDDAASWLDTATVQVRGLTAAMLHSAALPGRWYQDVVRPTMRPPHVDQPLTGGAFLEHHAYRAALDALVRVTQVPWGGLAAVSEPLARARGNLLAADLYDIERHAGMAYALVGGDPSLVSTDPDASAVGDLYAMRARRVERFRPLMRPGQVTV